MNYYKVSLVDCFLNKNIDTCFVKSFRNKGDLVKYLSSDFSDKYQFFVSKILKRDIKANQFCLYDVDFKSRCSFISFGKEFFK